MAQSLLFEVAGRSCLGRGHLTGPSLHGGSPRPLLSAPPQDTSAAFHHPGPLPPPPPPAHSKKSLLSAVKKLCLSYHSQTGLTRRKPRPGRANAGLCCGVYNSNTGPLCQGRMLSSALFEFLGAEFGRTQSRAAPMGFLRDRCPLYHLLAPDF